MRLQRALGVLSNGPPTTVFLGDSVLWGYRVGDNQTAVRILQLEGCACANLSFKASSPPNYYALVKLLIAAHVHPRRVVLEINQRVFNSIDDTYNHIHPAIAPQSKELFSYVERRALVIPPEASLLPPALDATLSRVSLLYGMRSDIRESLFPSTDASVPETPTVDMFQGTYDLQPLDRTNVGLVFLRKTVELLREKHIETIAFFTPTNHDLLHTLIDNDGYNGNARTLSNLLAHNGVRVLDYDRALHSGDFFDNSHLTPAGNEHLAELLRRDIVQK